MEDRAFFFLRSSSAFRLASSSSLRAFSSCGVWHTKASYSRGDSQLPQQPVSLQGMWSDKHVDEDRQLLFPALALRGWSFLLWTETGRTCRFFSFSRDLQFDAETRREMQRHLPQALPDAPSPSQPGFSVALLFQLCASPARSSGIEPSLWLYLSSAVLHPTTKSFGS